MGKIILNIVKIELLPIHYSQLGDKNASIKMGGTKPQEFKTKIRTLTTNFPKKSLTIP